MTHQNLKWTKKNKVFSHSEVTKRVLVGSRLLDLAFPFFSFFLLWKLKKRTWFVPILFSFRRGSCVNIVFISHEFQTFLGFHVKATNAAISSVSFRYLFYQPMDEKIKTWTLRFPAKENPNMEKALFDWPIVLQYDVKAKYRLISRKFSGKKFFHPSVRLTNQKPHAFVSVR